MQGELRFLRGKLHFNIDNDCYFIEKRDEV